jgi:hypothetical protein
MLSETEINRRLPVWCALSEMFVDTEFDDVAAASMTRQLRASGMAVDVLDRILRDEVAPVFHRNVFAGNWTGWPPEEVRRRVTAHLARRPGPLGRLLAPMLGRLRMSPFESSWREVRRRLADPA